MVNPALLVVSDLCIMYILSKAIRKIFLYTGVTGDLRKRFQEHNEKMGKSTKLYAPYKLIYYEAYLSQKDAFQREKMLKHHGSVIGHLKRRIQHSLEL